MGVLTVASEKASRLQMPVTARSGRATTARPRLVPERWGHAVEPSAAVTLCGRPLVGLYLFETMPFEHLGHHLRCVTCDALADHPHVKRQRRR